MLWKSGFEAVGGCGSERRRENVDGKAVCSKRCLLGFVQMSLNAIGVSGRTDVR